MYVHCTGVLWDPPQHTLGREKGKRKGSLPIPRAYKTVVPVNLWELHAFSFRVCSLSAPNFHLNKSFSLQNCFAHSLYFYPEGKDPYRENGVSQAPSLAIR